MILNARAKINWALKVCGLRPDGYHELDGVMQSVALHDVVRVEKADGIFVHCPAVEGENIAHKAARIFFERTGKTGGASVWIEKNIPVQAGLGGGSADAAAVLFALNSLYETSLGEGLQSLGRQVGADVPFCLTGGTARARGVGEALEAVALGRPLELLLMKPREGLCTKEIFAAYDEIGGVHPDIERLISGLSGGNLAELAKGLGNSLERAAVCKLPIVGRLLDALREKGFSAAGMSGSGPTVFAVCEDGKAALDYEDGWICRTRTARRGLVVVEG